MSFSGKIGEYNKDHFNGNKSDNSVNEHVIKWFSLDDRNTTDCSVEMCLKRIKMFFIFKQENKVPRFESSNGSWLASGNEKLNVFAPRE